MSERKLVRVRGVRATPGGWVWVSELTDGWATFPDRGAGSRRWQRAGIVLLVLLIAADFVVERVIPGSIAPVPISFAVVILFVTLVAADEVTSDRTAIQRWRARGQAILRAGGPDMLRQAVRSHGPARTVGEMNILLGSIGRTDPVFSTRRVRSVRVDRRWWRTDVRLDVAGRELTYRATGIRAPRKLAEVFRRIPSQSPLNHR